MRKQVKINALTYAQLIKFMLPGIYSCQELADLTGLHIVTVYQYARELRAAGAAFIDHWEQDARGRDIVKIYKLGEGKDAKRRTLTRAERAKRYRDALKKRAEAIELNTRMAGQ